MPWSLWSLALSVGRLVGRSVGGPVDLAANRSCGLFCWSYLGLFGRSLNFSVRRSVCSAGLPKSMSVCRSIICSFGLFGSFRFNLFPFRCSFWFVRFRISFSDSFA